MEKVKMFLVVIVLIASCSLTAQVSMTRDGSSPHPSAMLEVKDTLGGMLIPRMSVVQRLAITNPANGLMVYQLNGVSGFYYYDGTGWNRIGLHTGHYVGEPFGGGYVFWVDETGMHGLIVSMVDLDTAHVWSNIDSVLIGPTAQSVWNGPGNTVAIVDQQGHVTSAAQLCLDYINADYSTGTHSDWYLMTTGEAIHLLNNIREVQKALETDGNPATTPISEGLYWSSSEVSSLKARASGLQADPGCMVVKSEPLFVRAVRAF